MFKPRSLRMGRFGGEIPIRTLSCVREEHSQLQRFDDGYQAKLTSEFLQTHDICYVMKIHKRPRPGPPDEKGLIEKAFPVEDAMVYWPEPGGATSALSAEFREVARVKIKSGSKALTDGAC